MADKNPFDPGVAAPAGLQQASQSEQQRNPFSTGATAPEAGANPFAPRNWYSGANTQGTEQGWDTPFYQEWFKQQDEAVAKGDMGTFFNRPDVTGIVTYDHMGERDGKATNFRAGDVYEKGVLKGNLRDAYGDTTAKQMMFKLTADAKTQNEAFAEGTWEKEYDTWAEAKAKDHAGFASQQGYTSEVEEQAQEIKDDGGVWKTILGGIGAGAITGGGAGLVAGGVGGLGIGALPGAIIGGVIGGITGGVGAALNQDELIDMEARAEVQRKMARESSGTDAGIFTGLEGWSGVVSKLAMPFSNITHGAYDAAEGDVGDLQSSYYAIDENGERERPWWMTPVDLAAGTADSVIQFMSPTGKGLYMLSMGGNIAGQAGGLAARGGTAFDERTGDFDNIFKNDDNEFDFGNAAAGIGKIGIDAVQMASVHGMARTAKDARRVIGSEIQQGKRVAAGEGRDTAAAQAAWRGPEAGAGDKVVAGGKMYTLDAEGHATKSRITTSWLAPSEFIQNTTANWMARSAVRKRVAERPELIGTPQARVGADDVYQAISKLNRSENRVANALVNGFGEGAEEFVQEVLDPISHDATINWKSAGEAAMQGFAMGAGMTIGTGFGRPRQEQVMFSQFVANRMLAGDTVVTEEDLARIKAQWDGMTDVQRRNASAMAPAARAEFVEAMKTRAEAMRTSRLANEAMVDWKTRVDADRQAVEAGKLNDRVDSSLFISSHSDATVANNAVGASIRQIEHLFTNRHKGLKDQLAAVQRDDKVLPDQAQQEARVADLTRQVAHAENIRDRVRTAIDAYYEAWNSRDSAARHKVVEDLNTELRHAYDGTVPLGENGEPLVEPLSAEERLSLMKAVSMPLTRSPNDNPGSYQLLLPQVSDSLSYRNGNNGLQVSTAILKAIGGDFDGDKMMTMFMTEWTDEAFSTVRSGLSFLGNVGYTGRTGDEAVEAGTGALVDAEGNPTLGYTGAPGTEVNIGLRENEKLEMLAVARALRLRDGDLFQGADRFISTVEQQLLDRYSNTTRGRTAVIPAENIRELMKDFRRTIEADGTTARGELLSKLFDRFGNSLVTMGRKGYTNEWLIIDQFVQEGLQEWQTTYASQTMENSLLEDNPMGVIQIDSNEVIEFRQEMAATPGMSIAQAFSGGTMFRQVGKMQTTSWLAKVITRGKSNQSPNALELTRWYASLNVGATEQALAEVQAKHGPAARVMVNLLDIANEISDADNGKVQPRAVLAQLAMTKMPDATIREDGTEQFHPDQSLVQVLLRRAIQQERQEAGPSITEEHEAQLKSLESLLKPDSADLAFVEVFANVPLYTLMGASSDIIGRQMTVEQAVRVLAAQDEHSRQVSKMNMQTAPEYMAKGIGNGPYELNENGAPPVTAYQATMDAIIGGANKRYSADPDGSTNGEWGDKNGKSFKAIMQLYASIENIQNAFLATSGYTGMDAMSDKDIDRMMSQRPAWAKDLLDLLPKDLSQVVYEYREVPGQTTMQLHVQPWVYDMLRMPKEKAVMHYWRSLHDAKVISAVAEADRIAATNGGKGTRLTNEEMFDKLDDTFVQLVFRLKSSPNQALYEKFQRDLADATDLFEFMKLVNKEYRGNEAPYIAFVSDVREFDPNRTTILTPAGSAELRQNIAKLEPRSKQLMDSITEERTRAQADDAVVNELRADYKTRKAGNKSVLQMDFERVFAQAKGMPFMMGPQAMIWQCIVTQFGISEKMHNKAVSAEHLLPAGNASSHDGAAGRKTAVEGAIDSHTAYDATDIAYDMRVAASDNFTGMDENGLQFLWEQLTPEKFLDMWHSDVSARPALEAMLFPSVWERTAEGGLVQQALTRPSIAGLLGTDGFYQQVVKDETQEARQNGIALLEGGAREQGRSYAFQRELNDWMFAIIGGSKSQLSIDELQRKNLTVADDLYDVIRAVAELVATQRFVTIKETGEQIPVLDWVREEVRKRMGEQATHELLDFSGPDARKEAESFLKMLEFNAREQYRRDLEAEGVEVAGTQSMAAAGRAQAKYDEMLASITRLRGGSRLDDIIASHRFNWAASETEILVRQQRILSYLQTNGDLRVLAPWADEAFSELFEQTRGTDEWKVDGVHLTREHWDELSRVVMAKQVALETTNYGSKISLPQFPDPSKKEEARYWDSSYMYLLDHILDENDPLIMSMVSIHLTSNVGRRTMKPQKLVNTIMNTLMKPDNFAEWTPDIPQASVYANQRLDSSGADQAIKAAGSLTYEYGAERSAMQRSYNLKGKDDRGNDIDVENLASTVVLRGSDILRQDVTEVVTPVTMADGSVKQVTVPTYMMNGRFARKITATYGDVPILIDQLDENGALVKGENLLNMRGYELGMIFPHEPIESSHWQSFTNRRLIQAIEIGHSVSTQADFDWSKVKFTIEYLHPDSQPYGADFANSALFEGSSFEAAADRDASLYDTAIFFPGAENAEKQSAPLNANKKGLLAQVLKRPPKHQDRVDLEAGWETDLAGAVRRKAAYILTNDPGGGTPAPHYFNAIVKMLKSRHLVRGYNPATNKAELWSYERVVEAQRLGTFTLEDVELVKLSAKVLRKALGSKVWSPGDLSDANIKYDTFDISSIDPWTGDAMALVKRMPNLLPPSAFVDGKREFKKGSLLKSQAAHKQFLGRLTVRPPIPKRVKTEYERALGVHVKRQSEVVLARKGTRGLRKQLAQQAKANLKFAEVAMGAATKNVDWSRYGIPYGARSMMSDEQVAKFVMQQQGRQAQRTSWAAVWKYDHFSTEGPATGTITQHSMTDEVLSKQNLELVMGDLVLIDMASFNNGKLSLEEQYQAAQGAVAALAGKHVDIVLMDSTSNPELGVRVRQSMKGFGYENTMSARGIYRPRQLDKELSQNQRGRLTSQLEVRKITAQNVMASLITPFVEENAGLYMDTNNLTQVGVPVDLMATSLYGQFGVPQGADQIRMVKDHLIKMYRDKPSHLIELASGVPDAEGKTKAVSTKESRLIHREMKRLIDFWESEEGSTSIFPTSGWFGRGSLIPLVGPKDQNGNQPILLVRHGYQMPRAEEVARQTQIGGRNVAIFGTHLADEWNTHEGQIKKFTPNGPSGLSVELLMPFQTYFEKLIHDGTGLKNMLAPPPKDVWLPRHGPMQGWQISLITGIADWRKKQTFEGTVLDFQTAWAYMGVDHTPRLIKFFTGEDAAEVGSEARNKQNSRVYEILEAVQELPDMSETQVEQLLLGTDVNGRLAEFNVQFPPASHAGELLQNFVNERLTDPNQMDSNAHVALATLLYLRLPNTHIGQIISAAGFNNGQGQNSNAESHLMPRIFTEYFDRLPYGSQARKDMFIDLNKRFSNPFGGDESYSFNEDFFLSIKTRGSGNRLRGGLLQFSQPYSSGTSPRLNGMAEARQSTQAHSRNFTGLQLQTIGTQPMTRKQFEKASAFAQGKYVTRVEDTESLWRIYNSLGSGISQPPGLTMKTFASVGYERRAYKEIGFYAHLIPTKQWDEEGGAEEKNPELGVPSEAFNTRVAQVAAQYGLSKSQQHLIHYFVRIQLGKPDGPGEEGLIPHSQAMAALDQLYTNAKNGRLPSFGAMLPAMHLSWLSTLFAANQSTDSMFRLANKVDGSKATEVSTWEDWVHAHWGTFKADDSFDTAYMLAVDGFFHTYRAAGKAFGSLGISVSKARELQLMDEKTNDYLMSLSPDRAAQLGEVPLFAGKELTLDDFLIPANMTGTIRGRQAPASVRSQRQKQWFRWRKTGGVPIPKDRHISTVTQEGERFIHESKTRHNLMTMLVDLRVANATLNPVLFVSAFFETFVRGGLQDVTNILHGSSATGVSRLAAWMETKSPEGVKAFAEQFGFAPRLTYADIVEMRNSMGELADHPDFRPMIYDELHFKLDELRNAGAPARAIRKLAKIGTKMQDPTYGMRSDVLARRYEEGVVDYVLSTRAENTVSVSWLMRALRKDPKWVQQHMPEAHAMGMASIANVRSLKPTPVSMAVKGLIEPLSNSPHFAISVPSTIFLKIPLVFSGYAINVGTNILGLQGWQALVAQSLDGRRTPASLLRQRFMGKDYSAEKEGYFDMSAAIESVDLSKAFIQSGVSLTSLFAAGMMAGGLGLSGEDEEDRKRRRATELQGGAYIYDPRKVENDFRNSEAIYLDNMPFGIGNVIAAITGADPKGRAMVAPHWMLKQFISPIMGFERFFETGDPRQVMWGFQDAVGSFPLINSALWTDAVNVYAELQTQAANGEQEGTVEGLSTAFRAWNTIVMTFERMLFENSFANAVWVGMDDYDRDPWVIPLTDSDGDIQRDALGLPRPTKALQDYVDKEGNIKSGYLQNNAKDALAHSYAENRASYALFRSLFTGMADSTYLRKNMAVKIRELEKPEMTEDMAEALVLSIHHPEDGHEILTSKGARALYDGLLHKTIELDSPAMQGLYIPYEMRQKIQAEWLEEITQNFIDDQHYTESKAKFEANRRFFGDPTNPDYVPISQILWSDKIPYTRQLRYNQLNTTYTTGIDGKPWATGVTRTTLLGAFGLQPVQNYYGGQSSNMPTDNVLNSVDDVVGINTGLRALQKIDDSWMTPTDEEIGKSIEKAIKENASKSYKPSNNGYGNGWRRFPRYGRRGGGGGGGGGGGAYPNRLQNIDSIGVPFANDVPFINTGSPMIRRANIHRERFDSDRGRLNQWQ